MKPNTVQARALVLPSSLKRHGWVVAALVVTFAALLVASVRPAAALQKWTLAKTASPSTYSAAGQVITYTYVVTSLDDRIGRLVSLVDDKVASISCPTTIMPSLGSITCTGAYTIAAADVANGSVTNTATVTGDSCTDGCTVTAQATATVRAVAPPGSITIVKTATAGNGTFNFTSTIPGAASFSLVTVNGTSSRTFTSLAPGTYSVSEVALPLDWKLGTLTCTGASGGATASVDVANRTAAITVVDGAAITCTFVNLHEVEHPAGTQQVIRGFLRHRNALLATHEPDRSRLVRRLPGSLWGDGDSGRAGGANDAAFTISNSEDDTGSRLAFATSLSRLGAHPNASLKDGVANGPARAASPATSGLDVWVEGHFSDYRDRAGGSHSNGRFGVLYLGADYLLTPAILVGALVQFDWTGKSPGLSNTSIDGKGYMAGPYASVQLTQHLFFDARAAWGSSDNSVNPFGSYEDKFSTDRWLAHAKLTGNWHFGSFRVTPSLAYTYVEDKQESYADALGVLIPSQTVSLGRLSFGPEIGYRLKGADGIIWEPHASIQGVWDDTGSHTSQVGGLVADGNDFRGLVQAGVLVTSPRGPSARLVASYDGLGSSTGFHDLGGQVWVSIPLH